MDEDGPPLCVQLEPTICTNRTNTFASTSCGLKLSSAFWFKTLERERAHVRDQVRYSAGRHRPERLINRPRVRAFLNDPSVRASVRLDVRQGRMLFYLQIADVCLRA